MKSYWFWTLGAPLLFLLFVPGHGQSPPKVMPKLEAVAETRLLMEGLAHANFRGLERKLTARPTDAKEWTFARGQALLIAETANLLMLRPPKNKGEALWFDRSMELRLRAVQLAQDLAKKDFEPQPSRIAADGRQLQSLPPDFSRECRNCAIPTTG